MALVEAKEFSAPNDAAASVPVAPAPAAAVAPAPAAALAQVQAPIGGGGGGGPTTQTATKQEVKGWLTMASGKLKDGQVTLDKMQKKIDENSLVSDKEKKAQRAGPHTQTLRCPVVCSFSGVNVRSRRLH